MDILKILEQDYHNFPKNQHFELYADQVYFKDPLTEFRGSDRYQKLIGFMAKWFQAIELELHSIDQNEDLITTRWTLSWITPVPWQPHIQISGQSELKLDIDQKICSHIDYWDCSPWQVLAQHFRVQQREKKRN
jgi:hypothetical protein